MHLNGMSTSSPDALESPTEDSACNQGRSNGPRPPTHPCRYTLTAGVKTGEALLKGALCHCLAPLLLEGCLHHSRWE